MHEQIFANSTGVLEGHVRSIEIGSCNYRHQGFCKLLLGLVQKLPRDTLREFIYSSLARPDHQTLNILWENQRQLTNLIFDFTLESPSALDIVRQNGGGLSLLASVSKLDINFGLLPTQSRNSTNRDFLRLTTRVLSGLRRILLKFPPRDGETLPGTPQPSQPLLSSCLSRALTHISIWYTHFSSAAQLPLNDFPALEQLELIQNGNITGVLDAFSQPKLKNFIYRHDCLDEGDDQDSAKAIIQFLQRSENLKHLSIDCETCFTEFKTEAALSIAKHASSLEYLLINCYPDSLENEIENSFLKVASICKRLRQLSVCLSSLDSAKTCVVKSSLSTCMCALANQMYLPY